MLNRTSTGSRWHALADRVLAGGTATPADALAILQAPDEALLDLLAAAYRIRHHYFGNTVRLNFLVNAKSGLCPEDCNYCSQSRVSEAPIHKYPLMSQDELVRLAERAVALKASTCCIVLSGRGPSKKEVRHVAGATEEIKKRYPDLKVCACMGLLSEADARSLKDAGVDRYNHNLNTAESAYKAVCSTHTYQDRADTVEATRKAGISPCSGIIVGMGETLEQLVEVAFSLCDLRADSIPVNFLLPIEGTPLGQGARPLTPRFCLRVLSMARFVCPDREIRVSAGRERHLRSMQPLSLYPANSLFVADYLTEPGQQAEMDWRMIEDLGFEIEGLPAATAPEPVRHAPACRHRNELV